MRIGHGYDVHRLVNDRKLIIGGVNILYDRGLLGHSDADVLAHAVIDALLGASGLGDIGMMFPDNDPQFEGADSIELLRRVTSCIEEKSYKISNIDCTVIAQKPKLSPYTDEMADKIAKACNIERNRVNVKATTEERLGFTGSELGIAAHAVALLEE